MSTRLMVVRLAIGGLLLVTIGAGANGWRIPPQPKSAPETRFLPYRQHHFPSLQWLGIFGRFDAGICAAGLL